MALHLCLSEKKCKMRKHVVLLHSFPMKGIWKKKTEGQKQGGRKGKNILFILRKEDPRDAANVLPGMLKMLILTLETGLRGNNLDLEMSLENNCYTVIIRSNLP